VSLGGQQLSLAADAAAAAAAAVGEDDNYADDRFVFL